MRNSKLCARLLRGAALGSSVAAFASGIAHAGCTYAGGTRTCDTTTTTDTAFVFGGPATTNDRTLAVPPASAGSTANVVVLQGATVSGYGLALTTSGTNGPDLHFTNNGTVSLSPGNAPTTGGSSAVVSIVSDGAGITYDGSGSVVGNSSTPGIMASIDGNSNSSNVFVTVGAGGVSTGFNAVTAGTSGAGAVTVTTNGSITSSNGNGITTEAESGPTVVNIMASSVNAAGAGVYANSASGAITVNVTGGDVSGGVEGGIGAQGGTSTINIAAGRSVSSSGRAIFTQTGSGDFTINNSGTITGSDSAVNLLISAKTTINNLASGTINGRVLLSNGDDTFNNSGTWNASGANGWSGGTDLLANQSGGTINVANGTTFDSLETFTNAGTINVNGSLGFTSATTALTNSGTANLAANSSVTGLGTISNSGVLTAGAGSSLSAGSFANSGTFTTSGNVALTSSGGFSNGGTLNLATGGTLTSPVAAAAGSTSVINGAVIGDFANAGATSGVGSVTGAFTNSGALSPGNGGTGIFHVINGPFTQTSTGTLNIDLTPTATTGTGYDQLLVTGTPGTAALAGTLALHPQTGVLYVAGTNYDIIDAMGGISGAFATTTGAAISPFLSFVPAGNTGIVSLTGTEQVYRLTVSRIPYATGIGASATPNQIAVANGFQGLVTGATGDAATLVTAVDNMTVVQAQSFFDQASPEHYGAYANSFYNQGELFTRQVALQMHATPNTSDGFSIWGRGYGEWGKGRAQAYRFGSDQDIYGAALGLDYGQGGLTVGAAAGYSHDKLKFRLGNSSGRDNAWQFGGYLDYRAGPIDFDLQAAYESGKVRAVRTIDITGIANVANIARTATASPDGHLWRAIGTVGYDAGLGSGIAVRPFIGLDWSDGRINSFTEAGAGAADLTVDSIRTRRTDGVIGLDVGSDRALGLVPYARLAYKYDLSRHNNDVSAYFNGNTATAFTVSAVPTGRSAFDADAGLSYVVSRNFTIFAGYEGTYRQDLHSNGVSAGIRVGFGAEPAPPPLPPPPPPPPQPAQRGERG